MTAPDAWLQRRGQVVTCRYCGARIMLCEYRTRAGRALRRAVDEDTPRERVPRVAWFVVKAPGKVRRPRSAKGMVNPWHLFTCAAAPAENVRARKKLLAAAVARAATAARAARLRSSRRPGGPPVVIRRRRTAAMP